MNDDQLNKIAAEAWAEIRKLTAQYNGMFDGTSIIKAAIEKTVSMAKDEWNEEDYCKNNDPHYSAAHASEKLPEGVVRDKATGTVNITSAAHTSEPVFDATKHHPSCSAHDQDLVWHCAQCGHREPAYSLPAEGLHGDSTMRATDPWTYAKEDGSWIIRERGIEIGMAHSELSANSLVAAHNATLQLAHASEPWTGLIENNKSAISIRDKNTGNHLFWIESLKEAKKAIAAHNHANASEP